MAGAAWAQQDRRDRGWYGDHDGYYSEPYWQGGDHDRDDGYYRRDDDDYGRRDGRGFRNQAREFGYTDGVRDGQNDAHDGRRYRPEHDGDYKHADRGYSSAFGDRDFYRQQYRQAYLEGYRYGYRR
jgi:hypothetical protein